MNHIICNILTINNSPIYPLSLPCRLFFLLRRPLPLLSYASEPSMWDSDSLENFHTFSLDVTISHSISSHCRRSAILPCSVRHTCSTSSSHPRVHLHTKLVSLYSFRWSSDLSLI